MAADKTNDFASLLSNSGWELLTSTVLLGDALVRQYHNERMELDMKHLFWILVLLAVFVWRPVVAATPDSAGVIKSVAGGATIIDRTGAIAAAANMRVHNGDVITTDSKGYVGIIFEDDTVVSIGPGSRFCLDDFQFDPALDKLSFGVRMLHGTFSYLSGQIGKLAPQQVKLQTPDATLGIRGTKLLVKVE